MARAKKAEKKNDLIALAIHAGKKYVRGLEKSGDVMGAQGRARDVLVFAFAQCFLDGARVTLSDLKNVPQ